MATLTRILVFAAAILAVFYFVWAFFPARTEVVQPIAYNHNLHVEQEGLVCSDCHAYAEEMASASLPPLEVCQDCHDVEPLSESPEEAKLARHIEEEQEIPWKRVYEVPDHVYFSHRRHVALGELECSRCHGDLAGQTTPVSFPFLPVTMDACMDCHKEHKVTNDCLACHR